MRTGSTLTEPVGREDGKGGEEEEGGREDVSNPLTDHIFNSGENTAMAQRQTVTDAGGGGGVGGQQEPKGRKIEEGGERRRRKRRQKKQKTGSSTRPPAVGSSWGVTRRISA